jgi:hypothetical protein
MNAARVLCLVFGLTSAWSASAESSYNELACAFSEEKSDDSFLKEVLEHDQFKSQRFILDISVGRVIQGSGPIHIIRNPNEPYLLRWSEPAEISSEPDRHKISFPVLIKGRQAKITVEVDRFSGEARRFLTMPPNSQTGSLIGKGNCRITPRKF